MSTSSKKTNSGTWSQWRKTVNPTLKGKRFEDALVRRNEDGIACGPLFTHDPDRINTQVKKPKLPLLQDRPWHIDMLVRHPQIKQANHEILDGLNGGASAICLKIDPSGKTGIALRDRQDVARLLDGVYLEYIPVSLYPGGQNDKIAALFAAEAHKSAKLAQSRLHVNFSPLPRSVSRIPELLDWAKENAPYWTILGLNAHSIHEAGASPCEELAALAAMLAAYIRLSSSIVDINAISSWLNVTLASDQNTHSTIVKFRAARAIIARIFEAFGAEKHARTLSITAISSARILSKRDPWSNMIRNAACVSGAVLGGADHVICRPFSEPLGLPTRFAQRMARGLQLMYAEESHLGQVEDPASGSYTHEQLTNDTIQRAWAYFQEIEKRGGWFDANAQGFLREKIHLSITKRHQALQDGTEKRIGENQYFKPDIRKVEVLAPPLIKPKSGPELQADTFLQSLQHAQEGYILPAHAASNVFMPYVSDYEKLEAQS